MNIFLFVIKISQTFTICLSLISKLVISILMYNYTSLGILFPIAFFSKPIFIFELDQQQNPQVGFSNRTILMGWQPPPAVQFRTVMYFAVQCRTVQISVVEYIAVQCSAIQCTSEQCSIVHCSALWSSLMIHMQYTAEIRLCIVQESTVFSVQFTVYSV